MVRSYEITTSLAATVLRLGAGMSVANIGPRPQKPLQLYEFEGCPFCRKVREALSILDLDAEVYPCPQNGPRYRPFVVEAGGKAMFPFLVDPNSGVEMYESDDIIAYLFQTYGDGGPPLSLTLPVATIVSSALASMVRVHAGRNYRPSSPPTEPLELWSFEASPFCRLVRETLCELEIPYLLHNVAGGSASREEFAARSGKMMVPYLFDPNTGKEMFESANICSYLEDTYAR
jgi:glutathione S-transferase